jgi:hypothetical protein
MMSREERLYHAAQSVWSEGYTIRVAAGLWAIFDINSLIEYLGEDYEESHLKLCVEYSLLWLAMP